MDIKSLKLGELESLACDIRERILSVVSTNGGHLSSNLGVVELSIAMHYVFNPPSDPFIFDVSHQSYTHKLLSGRWDEFDSLRKFGGISGYTKPSESEYDYFIAGHSSTSISLAVGAAKAIRLKNENRLPVAVIGDGALSAGMAYEALNELGDKKYPCVIILNDNEMSISKPIGAMSKYLSQMMAGPFYQKFKNKINQLLQHVPDSAAYMAKRLEEGIRLITPGMFFEELGLEYIGPVNGHNIKDLISAFNVAKSMQKPVIVHVQTIKGKGYEIAEGPKEKWHGVSPFNPQNGIALQKSSQKNAT
ncbi:MAG: 1-deoxy-D-xylulose-5-phosphate synthase, partial [Campylobacter sp.]|nr:1-deoxy-D-xylulose-5-phosphate synthase [Campylobacter sp.]